MVDTAELSSYFAVIYIWLKNIGLLFGLKEGLYSYLGLETGQFSDSDAGQFWP